MHLFMLSAYHLTRAAESNQLLLAVFCLIFKGGDYYKLRVKQGLFQSSPTRTTAEVIADVNAALASGDRSTMLDLAGELDADNNFGCPLN